MNENEVGGTCGTQGRGMCTGFWCESQKEKDHLEDHGVDGRMRSEWILGRLAGGVWIGSNWLRIGTGGGLLWIRWWTFGFWRHGISYIWTTHTKRKMWNLKKFPPGVRNGEWKMQCSSIYCHRWQDEKPSLQRSFVITRKARAKNGYVC
jgi:hypothetical protein